MNEQFKVGQEAYILTMRRELITQKCIITKIGYKYVTTDTGDKFHQCTEPKMNYLTDDAVYGFKKYLFASETAVLEEQERRDLVRWLNRLDVPKLSLEKLRAVKIAIEQAEKLVIIPVMDNLQCHIRTCLAPANDNVNDIMTKCNSAVAKAVQDNVHGTLSNMPDNYLQAEGLKPLDVMTVKIQDSCLAPLNYEKAGFSLCNCNNCYNNESGVCFKYGGVIDSSSESECFRSENHCVFKVMYDGEEQFKFCREILYSKQHKFKSNHLTQTPAQIWELFKTENQHLTEIEDFHPEKISITCDNYPVVYINENNVLFSLVSKPEKDFSDHDKAVAKTHLENYGIVIIGENGNPIGDEEILFGLKERNFIYKKR